MRDWFQHIRGHGNIEIHPLLSTVASETSISRAEQSFGIKFPADYREFLMTERAVTFVGSSHAVYLKSNCPEEVEDEEISCMYGLADDEQELPVDIRFTQRGYHFDKWVGLPYLVICVNAATQICLYTNSGEVYGHGIQMRPPPSTQKFPGRTELEYLAKSFTDFCDRLEVEPRHS